MFKSLKSIFVGIARPIRVRRLGWAHWLSSFVLISSAFYIGLKGKENCFGSGIAAISAAQAQD
jgi:hypothetical protein